MVEDIRNNNPTIYLIPRWAGNSHSDWYNWLTLTVESNFQAKVKRLEMPEWEEPEIEKSTEYLNSKIKKLDKNTFFIGHSVGCQAILRFLDFKLKENPSIELGGFLFVAGWFTIDKPWISLKPWTVQNLDYNLIANQVLTRLVLISNNDPYTSKFIENKELFESKLNADVTILDQHSHFHGLMEPEILRKVDEMISNNRKSI